MDELLPAVVSLAESAGRCILRHYGGKIAVKKKADQSPLTAADLEADAVIRKGLELLTPGIPVITEETGIPAYGKRVKWRRFWLVDPLDGTKEFIKRNGEFTVNIALIDTRGAALGVVHAPALKLTYFGRRGDGARMKNSGGRVVKLPRLKGRSGRRTVATSRSHRSEKMDGFLSRLGNAGVLGAGSSLKFCYVAEGRASLYPRFGPTMEWDVAAGDAVLKASLGRAYRSPFEYNKRDLRNGAFLVHGGDREAARFFAMSLRNKEIKK